MAIRPFDNLFYVNSHKLVLDVGDKEIIEGISETVVSVTDQPAQAYQRLNTTVSLDVPGSQEGLALRPFGEGQKVFIKNGIGLWVEFDVRTAAGNDLALKPSNQKV